MIRTYCNRHLKSPLVGEIMVRVAYDDEPATIAAWDRNALRIAKEENIDPLEVHLMLLRFEPNIYGMPKTS